MKKIVKDILLKSRLPPPQAGEGWGECEKSNTYPSPQPSPTRGEGDNQCLLKPNKLTPSKSRSLKSKEKLADSLFYVANYLAISMMVWIAAPFIKMFDKFFEGWSEFLTFIHRSTVGWALSVWIIWMIGFVAILSLLINIRNNAMDLYDEVELANNRK